MNSKQSLLLIVAVLLAGIAIYLSKDWFSRGSIQIEHTIRPNRLPARQQERAGPAVKNQPFTVTFFFHRKCELTSIQVVSADELATNRFAHPLWELTSESNSIPTKAITYGLPIRGMRPTVKGARAGVLQSRVPYRLLVETADGKAEHDFQLR